MMADWDVISTVPAQTTPRTDPWKVTDTQPSESLMHVVTDKLRNLVSQNPVTGAGEILGSGVTGALSQIPAGLAGLTTGAINTLARALDAKEPFESAGDVVKDVRRKLTYQPQSASGQAAEQTLGHLVNAVKDNPVVQRTGDLAGEAIDKTGFGNEIRSFGPAALNALSQLVPLAKGLGSAAEMGTTAANAAEQAAKNAPEWQKAGFRTAETHPLARGVAGSSGKEALTIHNQQIGNALLGSDAGISSGVDLSAEALKAGRAAPNTVYSRVESELPTVPISPQAQNMIAAAGDRSARITKGSPNALAQINLLKTDLLSPEGVTGGKVVTELRGLRQEGYANIGSEDVSNQQLGEAQLDMARGLEQHILDSLPDNASVSLKQLQEARTALAKNSSVQAALRGKDIDLQAIARMQRADPDLLTGHMKTAADFANANPSITGLAGKIYNPPGFSSDLGGALSQGAESFLSPGLVGRVLGAQALARRVLTGNTGKVIDRLNRSLLDSTSGSEFAPLAPEPIPPGKPLLALPSPSMINAGGGATTLSALGDLGLTPDVRAAGAQHPGAARLRALQEEISSRSPMESVDFQGPQKWGDFSLESPGPLTSQFGGIPFENVLEQGGTQRPPLGVPGVSYRPPSKSPKQAQMRTPPGPPELTDELPSGPSAAQLAFRNKLAADRLRKLTEDLSVEGPGSATGNPTERALAALKRRDRGDTGTHNAAAESLLNDLGFTSDFPSGVGDNRSPSDRLADLKMKTEKTKTLVKQYHDMIDAWNAGTNAQTGTWKIADELAHEQKMEKLANQLEKQGVDTETLGQEIDSHGTYRERGLPGPDFIPHNRSK